MSKRPFVTKEQVEEIVKTYPTPFHIYDEKGIRNNMEALRDAFSWNKGFKEYFAVKATPNPYLINILREYNCGCDCSSYSELMLSEAIGATGGDIMFSSNDTPKEEYVYANELGAIINLDDISHIDFLEDAIGKIPETISCRFNPGGLFKISNNIMDNPGDAKYGMTPKQIREAYKILKSKGAKHFGMHAFLASNTVTNEYYPTLAKVLFEEAVSIQKEAGISLKFINLSGGIGIPYKPDQKPNDIKAIGEGVRKVFEEVLVPAGMGDVEIYTELGRFMMGPYGELVVKAIHEKNTYKDYIGVDACAVDLMRPAMYGAYHHITVLGKENDTSTNTYDITGSLCENNDKFAIDRELPKINAGDYLVIHDTGAHGYAMGYNYNGKLKHAELLLQEDGRVRLIRRAEKPADYFKTFDFDPFYSELEKTGKM
ncbi:MAG: diaminopimelate decarboxylase [Suipraeoptans sp.]